MPQKYKLSKPGRHKLPRSHTFHSIFDFGHAITGHEIPYAIRKNHDREWGHENSGEMIDSLKGLDLSYFTLQPVKKKPRDLSHDDPRRGKKVKRSPLHGIFRRNQKPSAVPPSGCLFGHSLDEISDGDKLPEPILVILQVLFLQGTYTVGVFRKPGNHKKCQDIKTKLDNGEPVTIDELTVPVAASLFKDFLMSLPNCLMGSHLFDQWVATANLTEDSQKEQRLNLCKKYISSLSQSQQNLLRHLMCVLHTIACVQMDKDQGMDAYGLAVCIGQSMLWPSLSNSCSMSDAVAKVPSVVQFLIENCEIIFGAQSLKIFGDLSQEVKQPQDSSTDSDSIHSLLSSLPEQQYVNTRDNSSLDSLERDCYYPEVDSSPQLAKSHLSPTNLSRDSGLTLSDTQLYEDCPDSESPSTTTRKPSYVRSYSQSDDQLPSADPGTLSSSQDAVILRHAGLPVPPPRKPKRRSAGPEFDNTATPKGLRNYGSTNIVCDHKRHNWNTPNSRRISDDSTLGSLDEEYPEELQTGLNLDRYRRGLDIGTLTKSESGAHLYLNDTDLMTSEGEFQHSLCLSSDQQPTTKTSTQDDYTRNDIQKLCGSLDLQASRNQSVADNQTFSIHSSLPTGLTAGISLEDLLTSSCSTASSAQSDLADAELYKPHMGNVKNDSDKTPSEQLEPKDLKSQKILNDSTKHPSSTSHVQLRNKGLSSGGSVDRSRRAKLVRSDAIEIKTLRKGMTPSGEDKFPAKIPLRKSLYSLDDDSLTKASTSGSNSSSSQPNCNQHHSPSSQQSYVTKTGSSSCRRSDSYSGLVPPLVRHLQQGIIEKSASDTVISEQFELSGPVRATSHPRPNNPPSYEEAVQRQSQRLRLSEQDIAVQQRNSAKAKKLYEESLKKYETAEIPGCCPPHRHQNKIDLLELSCHGSEQHPVGFRQPPPYQQACHRAADKQDQDKQKMYFQTKFTKYDGSQQLYGKKSREQHEDLTVGSTSEMDSEHGLRHQESFTRYSSAPQITAQSKLEQSQTEPCDQDHRTNHHPVEINQEVKQMESPVPLAGLPVRHANSTAHQIRSPVQRAGSNGHRTGSPVHYTNSAARRAHSSDHSLSSHVNSEARQSNAKSASKKSYNASSTVVGNQEFKHLGRSTANNQNRRHVANLTLTTVDSEELQNDQTKACEQIGQARDCSQQPNNREEVVSDNLDASSIQDKTVSEHISLVSCERSRQQHREGRRRSASRSRERRFDQRNSDPKLSSTKSAQITNLNRSKSDSQEHIDKVNRFKAFRAYENNKENISLEELRADSVISEYRCRAEQRPSNEYTRPPREESSRRRNVQNSCVLRTTSDKHQNSDSISASRRLSIPSSVRNRDWHKELASQYTETFFQPEKLEEAPNKVIRFGYLNSKEQCPTSAEKTRPRWTPPIHPTKDLIYVTKDDINTTETRQPRNMSMHSVKRRDNRSKSQERPISLVSDDVQKLQEFVRGRSETQHQKRNLNDVQNKMADVQALGDVSTNESGLNWSVAKLRNLYVGDKVQKERANLTARANNGTNPHFYTPGSKPPPPVFRHEERLNQTSQLAKCHSQKQQHYVKERTNPDADEAYV
ncbi:hypothetical protein LSH36_221g02021 [Paralvinella palmiformis]|uniref:Rho-GAP domain-containing protein n=1 Tax=Paralvinella palmiformis TaxID=53620 RepID=A0AAD9JPA6_9ANNE|nr:hypothetical protein LSH36_221g02021 [Paralvinella palmiformis]